MPDAPYANFVREHQAWLPDFALFMALKRAHGGAAWTCWAPELAAREPGALATFAAAHRREIEQVQWEQYAFFTQFHALKASCAQRGIQLMGMCRSTSRMTPPTSGRIASSFNSTAPDT